MRIVSWNVNGIRAVLKKDFSSSLELLNPDIICFQETKAQCDQVKEAIGNLDDFHLVSNSAVKKGYSGTAILSKIKPLKVEYDIGIEEHDQEGRVIAAHYDDFVLVTVYTPNSGSELKRLEYRQQWDKDFLAYLNQLASEKSVIVCGDLNVAHKDIDLARPKPNYNKSAGYMQEEIDGIDSLVEAGYVDTYRHFFPEQQKFSWWSYRAGARQRNIGWRIDYFLATSDIIGRLKGAEIHNEIMGSDHCPVSIEIQ